jgi:DNA polymerase-1
MAYDDVMTDALVILDGHAMLHRCYHAAPKRLDRRGVEVGAVLAACGQLAWLLGRMRSRHVVMALDPRGPTVRHQIDPEYKAHRAEAPEDLAPQLELLPRAVEALGVRTVCAPGFEADDVIATLVERGRSEGFACWMVGIDKDLFQLVTDEAPTVRLFVLKTRTVIDEAAVTERIGVPPSRAVDYYALVGDASDNIRGARAVGPKAATALLQRFGSLEGVFDNLLSIGQLDVRGAGRLPLRLLNARKDIERARQLVRLRRDVALDLGPLREALAWEGPRVEADALFDDLGDPAALRSARRAALR